MEQKIFRIKGIDCANCAAKIEKRIQAIQSIDTATLTFTTGQLRIIAPDVDAVVPQIESIMNEMEPGSKLIPLSRNARPADSQPIINQIYYFEGVDCASCAEKIEKEIQKLDGVQSAIVVFATSQLRIEAANMEALKPAIQSVFDSIEPGSHVLWPSAKNEQDDHTSNAQRNSGHGDHEKQTSDSQKNTRFRLSEKQKLITNIAFFLLLMIVNFILKPQFAAYPWLRWLMMGLFFIGYLYVGGGVLKTSWRNIRRGNIFDENFLMSVATIGAFIIGEYPEAVAVMLFYEIGEYFEHLAVAKSRSAITEAIDMRPEDVQKIVGEQIQNVPVETVSVGDMVIIKPGERIPLDGMCIDGESNIDTSPITGEPMPVQATKGSELISGCINQTGVLTMRVEKPLNESMVTRILEAVENAAANKPQIDRFIARFARIYTPIVCGLALLIAVIPPLMSLGTWSEWVLRGLTFLVVSCPCALVISVPMTFFAGIGRASSHGILFKGGAAMEALNKVKAVVMDKTGTITRGEFSVRHIQPIEGILEQDILQWAASAEQQSTHPIAASLRAEAKNQNLALFPIESIHEIAGRGIRAQFAQGLIHCGNAQWMADQNIHVPPSEGTEVYVAKDGQYMGNILVQDMPKADAAETISQMHNGGLHTAMLTGDNEISAQAVARQVGVEEVHAKLHPDEKLTILCTLRDQYGSVMFIGDGINDAPVLAGADVSAAMGSGADAAIEAADIVFMNSQMSAITTSMQIAKKVVHIAMQNIIFALAIKGVTLVLSAAGVANMWWAVFADVGVTLLCILNAMRLLAKK